MHKIYRGLTVGGAEEAFDAAYRNTDYIVYKLDDALRINEHSQTFDELLRKHGAKLCIFLTAWNPKSQEFSRAENDKRNEELVARVKHLGGFLTLAGEGKARTGDWPPEHSEAANQLSNKLSHAQHLDEVTWTTKNWHGLQMQRLSVVLHTAVAWQTVNELACGESGIVHGAECIAVLNGVA
ncbi:hypothetical protein EMIHUDRAFT_244293 [Emiliania huxleyi CCMP1516]|uniref:DUF3293 domain-containing protein n=2 Tax=Emiliania huxleyi TaxID=2903 RepID=A0A0D3J143_EMIH1|nr:hypothetical protein EMIHUDRAFT_244293 [Emiliania huxleyi CCMP1516]EOD17228.1 hypothetical protein EMIHUDRAFT_244293 [Emiliania huxleyi CCMP1516]|eukprot:XP_005769657.1 hypothetical protein EMIHUDRAFT_244293 [Emiliania huxleyi CCMP1516]